METTLIRTISGLLLLLVSLAANGQASFYNVYSGYGYDKGEGVTQLADHSYLVTGSSSSFEEAPSQAFLMHLSEYGNFLWSKAYGGPEFEEGKRVMAVNGFGYFIAGTSSSGPSGDFDAYLLFTDEAGNEEWQVFTDNGGWERVHDAILLSDTSVVVVGETNANDEGSQDLFIARYSKLGTLIWKQQLGTTGDDVGYSVIPASDTSFVVAGTMYVADSLQNKGYLAKFHKDGSQLWEYTFGTDGDYQFNDVSYIYGDKILAIGQRMKTGKTDHDIYSMTATADGVYIYSDEYYNEDETRFTQFVNYEAGTGLNYFVGTQVVAVVSFPTFPGGEDCFISRHNPGFYWDGYGIGYNGLGQDQVNDMAKTDDGYGIAVGFHTQYGYGGNSIFVVKIGNADTFPPPQAAPIIFSLVNTEDLVALKSLSVYPNPVSQQLNVEVEGQAFGYRLCNMNGQQLLSGTVFGQQSLDFSSQASGVYLLQITHESGEQTVVRVVK